MPYHSYYIRLFKQFFSEVFFSVPPASIEQTEIKSRSTSSSHLFPWVAPPPPSRAKPLIGVLMYLSMVSLGWGGGGQPTGITPSEAHVGREFNILNVPRVGNLTQPPSWKVEDQGMSDIRGPPSLKIPTSHLDQIPTLWCVHFFVKDGGTKLAFLVFEVLWQKVFCPSALRSNTCTNSHFGNMVSTYMFPPDALLPQVSDETKDQKIIHKDMQDFWNSVLDLLVYSKCPIKWNSGPQAQNNSLKTLTLLDDGM